MTATTLRGARRVLADCERNARWAAANDVPAWLAAVTAARVQAARARVAELGGAITALDPGGPDITVPRDWLTDVGGRDQ